MSKKETDSKASSDGESGAGHASKPDFELSNISVEFSPMDMKSKEKAAPLEGLAFTLVKAFARQLEDLKKSLEQGEVIMLSFSENGAARALHKIDLKVSGPEVISATATWLEGDTEQRVFAAKSFSPVLTKGVESSGLPEEVRSLVEQVLGHLTAHGVLYTQMLARNAETMPNAEEFLAAERARAIEVVRAANISAADMSGDEIRNKAIAVVDQTFDSIQVSSAAPRVLN